MKYDCLRCGMEFNQKNHLICHLNRKNICKPILEPMSIEEVKKHYGFEINILSKNNTQTAPLSTQTTPLSTQIAPKQHPCDKVISTQIAPKQHPDSTQIAPLSTQTVSNGDNPKHNCEFCGKFFTRNTGLSKHLKICNKNKMNMKEDRDKDEEIKELKQMVKELITHQNNMGGSNGCNNTINNNTNSSHSHNNTHSNNDNSMNIHINNYGCENKDYITKDYLIKLLKEPFQAIPRLIEYTHFNKDHPENQNIKLPNKKQPYVKVLKDDKWIYADRKSTILDLIDEKHSELNDSPLVNYVEEKFSEHLQDRFERFNDRYLNEEKDFTKQLYNETELVMINNS